MIVQFGLLAVTSLGWARFLAWREDSASKGEKDAEPSSAEDEAAPKTDRDFTGSERARQRYWQTAKP